MSITQEAQRPKRLRPCKDKSRNRNYQKDGRKLFENY